MTSNRPKKAFNLNVTTSVDERGLYKAGSPGAFNRFGARPTANLPQPYLHQTQQQSHFYPIPPSQQQHTPNQPNYAYQNYPNKPGSAKISLVPSEVSSIHHSHLTNNCSNKNKKSAKYGSNPQHHSAPNSLLATPSTSLPATPCESRRPSGKPSGSIKKSESESFHPGVKFFRSRQSQPHAASALPKAIPRASALAVQKPINLNNKAFKFEEYMPLCKVQNMLSKGQVVEVSSKFVQCTLFNACCSLINWNNTC